MHTQNMGLTPEERVARQLRLITTALEQAVSEAAGEDMGYILIITPVNRVGCHLYSSNIAEVPVIVKFLRMMARQIFKGSDEGRARLRAIQRKGLNS